jgi:hypothetical protein
MHIKIIKLGFLLALNLFSLGHLFSQDKSTQQLFVHLENTNILVRGLENPIQISSKMGGDYSVTTKSAAIIKKTTENEYTVNPKNVKEDTMMLEIVSKKNAKVKNVVKFKIMDLPLPRIKFGMIEPKLNMSKSEIMYQAQLDAVIDNFFIDGMRYKVISYTFNYVDYSQGIRKIKSIKVIGNSLQKTKAIIQGIDAGEKLEFSDIQVETASGIVSVGNIIISFK